MASKVVQSATRKVRPILSLDRSEAKRRVFNLYKAWYRQIPYIVQEFDIPVTVEKGRAKLREYFERHTNVTDIRAIDMMVIKGQMELVETVSKFKQRGHVMDYFKETVEPKPADFLSKFLSGQS